MRLGRIQVSQSCSAAFTGPLILMIFARSWPCSRFTERCASGTSLESIAASACGRGSTSAKPAAALVSTALRRDSRLP